MRTCGGGQNTGLSLYASGVAAVWIQELRLRSLSWLDEPGSAVHMIGCWSGSPTRWNPSQSMVRRRAQGAGWSWCQTPCGTRCGPPTSGGTAGTSPTTLRPEQRGGVVGVVADLHAQKGHVAGSHRLPVVIQSLHPGLGEDHADDVALRPRDAFDVSEECGGKRI